MKPVAPWPPSRPATCGTVRSSPESMSPLAALVLREYPVMAGWLLPLEESWSCAVCGSNELRAFGTIGTNAFSARRFGGREFVVFFLCDAHRGTPRAEVEDAIETGLEDSPPARGTSLYVFTGR